MNAPTRSAKLLLPVLLCATALACAFTGSTAQGQQDPGGAGADQMVECRLPPQIRHLGENVTFLAAGQQVRTTTADCKIRGGRYSGGNGPGAYAHEQSVTVPGVPITVGGNAKALPCPQSGVVKVVEPKGALTVHTGPGLEYASVDRLGNGKIVAVCNHSRDKRWLGVVYSDRTGVACGLDKPIPEEGPYDGACLSGWISNSFVK